MHYFTASLFRLFEMPSFSISLGRCFYSIFSKSYYNDKHQFGEQKDAYQKVGQDCMGFLMYYRRNDMRI